MNLPRATISGKATRQPDRHRASVTGIAGLSGSMGRYCAGLILAIAAGTAAAREIKCFSEIAFAGEGALQMTVKMEISRGRPSTVDLSHLTLVYGTKTGYQCDAHFSLDDASQTWQFAGRRSTVSTAGETPEESSRLVVERSARGYRLDTRALSTADCGVRGQWPASVFVPAAGGRCRTKYE